MSKTSAGLPKRLTVGVLATALSVFGMAFAGPAAASNHETETERLAGATRFGTAADVCAQLNEDDDIDLVVIASGRNFPDALAAAPLAISESGCVLLVEPDSLPEETLAALDEVTPDEVVIVGGTTPVSQDVEDAIEDEGYDTTRIAGETREETAVAVAERIADAGNIEDGTVILATGNLAPDALAAGGIAGGTEGDPGVFPILLSRGANLSSETEAAIEEHADNVIVVGGTAAVSESAADQAGDASGDADVERLAGTDRHETAVAIAQFAIDELDYELTSVILASGRPPAAVGTFSPDALVAGPLAADRQAPILLTESTEDIGEAAEEFLAENGGSTTLVLCVGGTAVISNAACDAAAEAAEEAEANPTTPTNQTATTRPELVTASLVTVDANNATTSRPAGTYVTYCFDEAITGGTINAAQFHVYASDTTRYTGSAAGSATTAPGGATSPGPVVSTTDNKCIVVPFSNQGLDTAAAASQLTVATVDDDAVRGASNAAADSNIEGDAPLTPANAGTTATAGFTAAPDLVSVGNFRAGATADVTAVDFTFDAAAFVQNQTGFRLVTTTGGEVVCTGPAEDTTNVGGGTTTVAGGEGTTTITVLCNEPVGGATFSATSIVRGFVEANTVDNTDALTGPGNPLEAADVSNSGNSDGPDLVSVIFAPDAAVGNDAVAFLYDEAVTSTVVAGGHAIYDTTGAENSAATCVRSTENNAVVTCFFADNTLSGATYVGGNVDTGTVTDLQGIPNRGDEVGTSPSAGASQTAGRTSGPDLTGVAITAVTSPFGTTTYNATYTFDEDTADTASADAVQSGEEVVLQLLHLYTADGIRLDCAALSSVTPGSTVLGNRSEDADATVTCTSFTVGGTATAATAAQVQSAVVGTVDFGAVDDESNAGDAFDDVNPEGAALTTGGNGTPAS